MKRDKPKSKPYKIPSYFPFMWTNCDTCGKQFKFESGTKDYKAATYTVGRGLMPDYKWYYYCKSCTEKAKR